MLQESKEIQKKPYLLLIIAGSVLALALITLLFRNKSGLGSDLKFGLGKRTNVLVSILSDSDQYLFSVYAEIYPQEKKAALFFVNPLTSFEDEKTLEDYGKKAPGELDSFLEDILDFSIQHKIIIRENQFHAFINLLGGVEFFFEPKSSRITNRYERKNRIYNLDGEDCFDVISYLEDKKMLSYIHRLELQESMVLSILETIHRKPDSITKQKSVYLHEKIENNMDFKEWDSLLDLFRKEKIHIGVSELPAEPILRIKKKDEILKTKSETVKVALTKFLSDVRSSYYSDGERARIEILNGTEKSGLARYGKSLLNDKGLKVLSVDNAWDTNFDKSVILNRSGNTQYTETISETFQGRNVYFSLRKDLGLDATVVLGEDFQNSKE